MVCEVGTRKCFDKKILSLQAPQADANVLQGVLRNINAFDASMDTETGSLTDASEDTEMWRGTHDGQQDSLTTPRSAFVWQADVVVWTRVEIL